MNIYCLPCDVIREPGFRLQWVEGSWDLKNWNLDWALVIVSWKGRTQSRVLMLDLKTHAAHEGLEPPFESDHPKHFSFSIFWNVPKLLIHSDLLTLLPICLLKEEEKKEWIIPLGVRNLNNETFSRFKQQDNCLLLEKL